MDRIIVEMETEKETRNTVRYAADSPSGMPPAITTLYVAKWALGKELPERVRITVEAA